jgi:hypothetical protein
MFGFYEGRRSMKRSLILIMVMVLLMSGSVFADLVDQWRFDETDGNTAHNSIGWIDGHLQSNYGTVSGGGIWQPTQGLGGALDIPTGDERVRIDGIHMTPSWTVMGWIKPAGTQALAWNRLICSSHMDGFFIGLSGDTSRAWTVLISLNHPLGGVLYGPAYEPNAWQHVAAVYDSDYGNLMLYVDGTGYGPTTCAQVYDSNLPIFIGSDYYAQTDPSITGLYDDFAIYNTALGGADVWAIYQAGLAGKSINYWQATNPSPADGDINQPVNVNLSWTTGSNPPSPITNHVLYFGTDPNNVFNSTSTSLIGDTQVVTLPVGTTSYAPGFSSDKTIYWRVDEKINSSTQARGAIWTFETIKMRPQITQQPQNQRADVNANESVTFTVVATSASTMSYQWYKDTVLLPGKISQSLTITNVKAGDAGGYYVVITNAVGSTTSNTALLILKGLLGHWPLDGNANDTSGYGNDGNMVNGPTFVAGIDGHQAISLNSGSVQYIEIPNEAHFDIYDAFSVSFWMDANLSGQQLNWATMVSKGGNNGGWNVNRADWMGFVATHLDFDPDLANMDTPTWVAYNVPVFDNAWHLITFVYDGTNEYIYIDGKLAQSTPAQQAAANNIPVDIGVARVDSTGSTLANPYNGLLYDVRIYNYAITATEIAQLYYSVTGNSVCVNRPAGDLNGDCVVDLKDFAIFAAEWLNCGVEPGACFNISWSSERTEPDAETFRGVILQKSSTGEPELLSIKPVSSVGHILVAYASRDGGATWQLRGTLASDPNQNADLGDTALMLTNGGDVLCSYRQNHYSGLPTAQKNWSIRVAISHDKGYTWQPHSVVAQYSGYDYGLWSSWLIQLSDGRIQCYYDDEVTPYFMGDTGSQYWVMKTWSGTSWVNQVIVSKAHTPGDLSRDGSGGVVEISPGKLVSVVESVHTEMPRYGCVRMVSSSDYGATWSWISKEREIIYGEPWFQAFAPCIIKLPDGSYFCAFMSDEQLGPGAPRYPGTLELYCQNRYIIGTSNGTDIDWEYTSSIISDERSWWPGGCMWNSSQIYIQYWRPLGAPANKLGTIGSSLW